MWLSFEHGLRLHLWGTILLLSMLPESAIAQIPDLSDESTQDSEPPTELLIPREQRLPSPQTLPLPANEQTPLEDNLREDDSPFDILDSPTSTYVLGPGDQISVSVIDFPEFSLTQAVLPDGTITLPLIGAVQVSDKTLETLRAEVTRRLSAYLVEPAVEVNLVSLRPTVVTVGGEVFRPGPIQLSSLPNDATAVPTVSTALVSAGGVRRTADLQSITIQRRLPNGDQEILTIDLWESIFRGGEGDDILLQDKDVIFVPRATAESEIDPQLVSRSSLAPEQINVRVIGEVNRAGEISVAPDATVLSALASAGGHSSDANLRDVALLRLNDNGQLVGQQLDLRSFEDTTPIQNDDIIVVPKRGYLSFIDGVSRTLRPITSPFSFLLLLDNVFGSE